ncbi:helix-turn-helix domain-containing protein [Amycolatopsis carbonis]|uniref:Helix-turn-helix domain-containing protein n=1 Tax=Amycolatopsis carbonis TaxID=715471 RepID=A0A9Y2MYD1_9PSEU|nr:LuxR family transcriptional regulator [Amycolatopsis sp. 2-15]WIX83351.1 helix-turn-helix domain-containing protein [Amycolatopsis sp. 2-15]
MLEALGLTADEERVFRVLVGGYRATAGEVAARLGLAVAEVERVLGSLVAKRLVSRTGEHYVPAPPDVSLGPLLRHGQSELERARSAVTELAEQYRDSARRRDSSRLVEVVTGAEAIRQQALSLQRDAREEVLWFCREAPIAMPAAENDEEFRALARGVRFRVLYETALLEEPGAIAGLAEGIRLGERARTIAKLPVRLAVADRALALCPLADDEATGEPTAALVLGSSLVTGLVALFESYWERASPLRIDGVLADAPLSAEERRLLSLLVGGVSDKSIAKHLGVSHRTVQRRLQDLMQRADAQSRMQLAWQVAKLGWLDG